MIERNSNGVAIVELNAIGCAIELPEAAKELISIPLEAWKDGVNRKIAAAIKAILDRGETVTVPLLDNETGGKHTVRLFEAMSETPTTVQYLQHMNAIRREHARVLTVNAAYSLINTLTDPMAMHEEAMDTFAADTQALRDIGKGRSVEPSEAIEYWLDTVGKAGKQTNKRVYFGIKQLDDLCGGICGGKLVTIGARPGVGKSALALTTAVATAKNGGRVLFVSREMPVDELISRIISEQSGVSTTGTGTGMIGPEQWTAINAVLTQISKLKLDINVHCKTTAQIRSEAIISRRKGDLALIVVDYIGLINLHDRSESERVRVGRVSHELKELALDLGIPVLCLAQLNRESEKSTGKKPLNREPLLSDFRETGDIEQDSDIVLLLYEPNDADCFAEQELKTAYKRCENENLRYLQINVAKHRGGARKKIGTAFNGALMRYTRVPQGVSWVEDTDNAIDKGEVIPF